MQQLLEQYERWMGFMLEWWGNCPGETVQLAIFWSAGRSAVFRVENFGLICVVNSIEEPSTSVQRGERSPDSSHFSNFDSAIQCWSNRFRCIAPFCPVSCESDPHIVSVSCDLCRGRVGNYLRRGVQLRCGERGTSSFEQAKADITVCSE